MRSYHGADSIGLVPLREETPGGTLLPSFLLFPPISPARRKAAICMQGGESSVETKPRQYFDFSLFSQQECEREIPVV